MDFIRMICLAACVLETGIVAVGFIPAMAAGIERHENAIMTMFGITSILLAALVAGIRYVARRLREHRLSLAGHRHHEQPDMAVSA